MYIHTLHMVQETYSVSKETYVNVGAYTYILCICKETYVNVGAYIYISTRKALTLSHAIFLTQKHALRFPSEM